jgi:hypothetical protein
MLEVSDGIIVALIGAIGAPFVKGWIDERKARKEKAEEQEKMLKALLELEIAVKSLQTDYSDNTDAHIAIIRDRLIQAYDFFTKKNTITLHQRDTIAGLYAIYKNLIGDNTFVVDLFNEIMKIPYEKEG